MADEDLDPEIGEALGIPTGPRPGTAAAAYGDRPASARRPVEPILPNAEEAAMLSMLPPAVGMAGKAAWTLTPKMLRAVLGMGGVGTAAAVAGTGGPEEGVGADFVWSDPNKKRQEEISRHEQAISTLNPRLDKLIEQQSKAKGPATIKQIGEQATNLREQVREAQTQLTTLREQENTDQKLARTAFTEAAKLRRRQETSWFDAIPGTRAALPIASAALSHGVGHYIGKRMPWYASIPTAGAIGGGFGAYSVAEPNSADMSLPPSAPARKQAITDLQSGDYWTRLLSSAGGSSAAAMLGAVLPAVARRGVMSRAPTGTPSTPAPAASPQPQAAPPMAVQTPQAPATPQPIAQATLPPTSAPSAPAAATRAYSGASSPPPAAPAAPRAPMNPNQGLIYDPKTKSWTRDPADPANAEWFRLFGGTVQDKARQNAAALERLQAERFKMFEKLQNPGTP